jgi:hypothetical protein
MFMGYFLILTWRQYGHLAEDWPNYHALPAQFPKSVADMSIPVANAV